MAAACAPKAEHRPGPTHTDNSYECMLLFDEHIHLSADERISSMKYYLYDPIAHGAEADKEYPLIVIFHGANNGKEGAMCTAYTDCSVYAGPEYQALLGGAYILFPKANEGSVDDSEPVTGTWMTRDEATGTSIYVPDAAAIISEVLEAHPQINPSKVVVGGTSAGGYMTWNFIIAHPELPCAAFLMAPAYNPTDEQLATLSEMPIWVIHGIRDEICTWERFTGPIAEKLQAMPNVRLSALEDVCYGDKTPVQMVVGEVEMGQHLALFCVGANMIYDDGTPYDEKYPLGFIDWLLQVTK